jgi:hypothetical protein
MAIFRANAIWLPRIVAALLLVFTIDVALAATCCSLPMDSEANAGETMAATESGSDDTLMPKGSECPLEEDSGDHPDHNACCLACVALVPASELPELDIIAHSFNSLPPHKNSPMRIEQLFRPPINRLL